MTVGPSKARARFQTVVVERFGWLRDALVGLDQGRPGRLLNIAFVVRVGLLVFTWTLVLVPSEPHFDRSPRLILLALVVSVWAIVQTLWLHAALESLRAIPAPRRARRQRPLLAGVLAADFVVSFGAYAAAGGWDNALQAQTYAPVVLTALLTRRFLYGLVHGTLSAACFLVLAWMLHGASTPDVADGERALALHYAGAYLAWGIGGTWFAGLVSELVHRARRLEHRIAREEAARLDHDGRTRILWILHDVVESLGNGTVGLADQRLASAVEALGRQTGAISEPEARPRDLRGRLRALILPSLDDLTTPERARDWGRMLMIRVAFNLRLVVLTVTPAVFLVGVDATATKLGVFIALLAWTLLLYSLSCGSLGPRIRGRARAALRLPLAYRCRRSWLVADLVICLAGLVALRSELYVLAFVGVCPLIFAGAFTTTRRALAVTAAVIVTFLFVALDNPRQEPGVSVFDPTMVRLQLTYVAWGLGFVVLTQLIVRLARENGRRAQEEVDARARKHAETALYGLGDIIYSALTDNGSRGRLSAEEKRNLREMLERMRDRALRRVHGTLPFPRDANPATPLAEVVSIYDLHPTRRVALQCTATDIGVEPANLSVLVEITEEALCNAIRHAREGRILVALDGDAENWILTVIDPGSDAPPSSPGRGSAHTDRLCRYLGCAWQFTPGFDEGRWQVTYTSPNAGDQRK